MSNLELQDVFEPYYDGRGAGTSPSPKPKDSSPRKPLAPASQEARPEAQADKTSRH
jgi:hypothetical protein